MRQPTLPNRKRPEFRYCLVCAVEFWVRHRDQRWCSTDCAHRSKLGSADVLIPAMRRTIAAGKEQP